ncbi:MAG: hypothetical protein CL963_03080 [Euryarchaeota archaeon]|nr:hypothetical protein [Euryarchaeota archaeon]
MDNSRKKEMVVKKTSKKLKKLINGNGKGKDKTKKTGKSAENKKAEKEEPLEYIIRETEEERMKEEIKEAKARDSISKHLEKVTKELDAIGKKEVDVTGIERMRVEISKLKEEITDVEKFREDVTKKRYFGLFSVIILLLLLIIPMPGLSILGQRAIAIFVFIIILWVSEVVPLPVTAFLPGILLYFFGIYGTPTESFKTYAHPAVFFIIGSLLLAQGLTQSGIAKRLAVKILTYSRNSANLLLLLFVTVSAFLAMFISDHTVAAMLIPVAILIVSMIELKGPFRIALVLAVAFGASIGGLATPSGGARNAVTLGFLQELAGIELSYFTWMKAAAPLTLIMIPIVWIILRITFPPPKDFSIENALAEIKKTVKPMSTRQWRALGVFGFTILLFITSSSLIDLGTIAIFGSILMFLAGVIDWEEAERSIPWGIMFIYGAAITMGISLKDTGAAEWLARGALNVLPSESPLLIMLSIIIVAAIATEFLSGGASAAILIPISLNIALISNIDPVLIALVTAIPTAFAFLTVYGTPPNTMAYSTGYFKQKDLLKAGLMVEILILLALYTLVKTYWITIGIWSGTF